MKNLLANSNIFNRITIYNNIFLPFFRVFIGFHVLKKLILNTPNFELLYGNNSFVVHHQSHLLNYLNIPIELLVDNYPIIVFSTMLLSSFFIFGVGKHFTALLLYFSVELIQNLNHFVLNGGDNLLKFILLYLVFANSYKSLCLSPLKINSIFFAKISKLLTFLAVFSIQIHLCLIYFVTGLHKAHSEVWFNGIATYYTFALERFQGTPYNKYIIQNGYLVTFSTYITLIWELSFIFLVWNKKVKNLVLFIGLMLHLGIYIFMMIYDFEILFIMIYGFFISLG